MKRRTYPVKKSGQSPYARYGKRPYQYDKNGKLVNVKPLERKVIDAAA